MLEGDKIKVAQGENPCYLLLNQANRHGSLQEPRARARRSP